MIALMQISKPHRRIKRTKVKVARNSIQDCLHTQRMIENSHKLLWNYEETAHHLSLTVQALRDLVYKGRGPKVTRIGQRAMFRPVDVKDWVDNLASAS